MSTSQDPATTAFARLQQASPTVSVGMITADLLSLGSEIRLLEEAGVPVVHFDVMDGVFCPMMTIGPPLVKAVKTTLLKDVHLMVDEPLEKVDAYVAAGADIITVHAESTRHLHQVLMKLGKATNANDPERGIVRGVALNPGTPVEALAPVLDELEMVLVLAVNPGFSGQGFLPGTVARIARVREMARAAGREVLICVDGGIKKDNIAEVGTQGADLIVTGSAVFDGKTPRENAAFMLEALRG